MSLRFTGDVDSKMSKDRARRASLAFAEHRALDDVS
jgi:hypothetical protein